MTIVRKLVAAAALLAAGAASAATFTWTDIQLASGNPVVSGGVTLTTTNAGGSIGFIGAGLYAGLWLGGSNTGGTYTLGFSQNITSIEIEFDALSSTGQGNPESLSGFATNLGGATVSYLDQGGTSFAGNTVTSQVNDGQGTISFTGSAFNIFSFAHSQGQQNGFVIERITINTADTNNVPEPAGLALLGLALVGLSAKRRRAA